MRVPHDSSSHHCVGVTGIKSTVTGTECAGFATTDLMGGKEGYLKTHFTATIPLNSDLQTRKINLYRQHSYRKTGHDTVVNRTH